MAVAQGRDAHRRHRCRHLADQDRGVHAQWLPARRFLAAESLQHVRGRPGRAGHVADLDRHGRGAQRALPRVPDLTARVSAIAVTGQGDGTWLIDDDGRPVAPALLWLDSRAAKLVGGDPARPHTPRLYQRTGSGLNACQQGAQLAWFKTHAPECVSRAKTAFHCKDWLYFLLTGERATDPSEATFHLRKFPHAWLRSGDARC